MDKQAGIRSGTPEDLSLDGSLSGFFARKGILFDQDTGLFRIENNFNKQIHLTSGEGDGPRYAMIRKALLRNGIMASPCADTKCRIEIKEKEISIHRKGQETVSVYSIEELLDEIRPYSDSLNLGGDLKSMLM
jgi:iron complex transport system ATP-binding protein